MPVPASHRAILPSCMASSIRWLNWICSGRCAIPWAGRRSLKNMVDQFMGFQPVVIGIHPIITSFPVMLCFRFHRICSARPGGKREQYGQGPARPSRAYFRDLYCFQSRSSQPLHAGQCIVSHYLPEQRLCGRRCQRRPCAGKIARHRKLQGFPRVVAHTARIALLSGWLSVLLVCNFQGTARAIRSPSLSSRKLRSVNTLISRNFQKTFLRSRRMRSLRLMTARWLTPIL